VLVLGAAGGIGVAGIQLAKALGSRLVIGATRDRTKIDTVKAAGADHVVDTAQPNLREALREEIRHLTGGEGVDIVLDPVGGAATEAAPLAQLARPTRLHRLRGGRHPDDSGQLPAGEEHRCHGPAMVGLPRTRA
jgi:NADPH:quinone reductase-like Zn-dependent oxidoreductase